MKKLNLHFSHTTEILSKPNEFHSVVQFTFYEKLQFEILIKKKLTEQIILKLTLYIYNKYD